VEARVPVWYPRAAAASVVLVVDRCAGASLEISRNLLLTKRSPFTGTASTRGLGAARTGARKSGVPQREAALELRLTHARRGCRRLTADRTRA
jgi:hypothetical protein